jgi:hypothetical protein
MWKGKCIYQQVVGRQKMNNTKIIIIVMQRRATNMSSRPVSEKMSAKNVRPWAPLRCSAIIIYYNRRSKQARTMGPRTSHDDQKQGRHEATAHRGVGGDREITVQRDTTTKGRQMPHAF